MLFSAGGKFVETVDALAAEVGYFWEFHTPETAAGIDIPDEPPLSRDTVTVMVSKDDDDKVFADTASESAPAAVADVAGAASEAGAWSGTLEEFSPACWMCSLAACQSM